MVRKRKAALVKFFKIFSRIALLLIVLETVFVIHEYGHLREFQKSGIPVKEFSLGIGWLLYQHQGEEFAVSVRAIPIMAYVMPTDEGYETFKNERSSWTQVIVFSAGVRNNIASAVSIIFLLQILGWKKGNRASKELLKTMALTPLKIVSRFFCFLAGCMWINNDRWIQQSLVSTGGLNPPKLIRYFIALNLLIGLLNLLPHPMLDGGKIFQTMLPALSNYLSEILNYNVASLLSFLFFYRIISQNQMLFEFELTEKKD